MLLHAKIREAYIHPQFNTDVMKPLEIDKLMDQEVIILSYFSLYSLYSTLYTLLCLLCIL